MVHIPSDGECELETLRLCLDPMLVSDVEPLFALLKEPRLYTFTRDQPPTSLHTLEKRVRAWESRRSPDGNEVWLNWTLRNKGDAKVIGYTQASVIDRKADLAWVIGIPFQGRGYAKEAVREMVWWLIAQFGIQEFRASIHPDHIASQSVAKYVGLHQTPEKTDEGEEMWLGNIGKTI